MLLKVISEQESAVQASISIDQNEQKKIILEPFSEEVVDLGEVLKSITLEFHTQIPIYEKIVEAVISGINMLVDMDSDDSGFVNTSTDNFVSTRVYAQDQQEIIEVFYRKKLLRISKMEVNIGEVACEEEKRKYIFQEQNLSDILKRTYMIVWLVTTICCIPIFVLLYLYFLQKKYLIALVCIAVLIIMFCAGRLKCSDEKKRWLMKKSRCIIDLNEL